MKCHDCNGEADLLVQFEWNVELFPHCFNCLAHKSHNKVIRTWPITILEALAKLAKIREKAWDGIGGLCARNIWEGVLRNIIALCDEPSPPPESDLMRRVRWLRDEASNRGAGITEIKTLDLMGEMLAMIEKGGKR